MAKKKILTDNGQEILPITHESCVLDNNGQLGLGDTAKRTTFTQVTTNINNDVKEIYCGQYHTFILKNRW